MTQNIKYIFFGSPEFAEIILSRLISAGFVPQAVVTNPDRPTGRKKVITPPMVKILAEKNGIKIFQPENLNDEFIGEISKLDPELFVVAAYAKIIPKNLLELPALGAIGIHPSLLPKYRGASPIQSVILAGDAETGATIYLLDEKTDHGPVFWEKALPILPAETYPELLKRLAVLSGELIAEILPKIYKKNVFPVEQKEELATFTKKITAENAFVDEKILGEAINGQNIPQAETIGRMIRALNPEPGVWTLRQAQGKLQRMKLLEAEVKDGHLILKTIQVEGKKPTGV